MTNLKNYNIKEINKVLEAFKDHAGQNKIKNKSVKPRPDKNKYNRKNSDLNVGKIFGKLDNENIYDIYVKIEDALLFYFWNTFCCLKLFNKIDKTVFERMLLSEKTNIYDILKNKGLCKTYETIIKKYILKHETIELLIAKETNGHNQIYLPRFTHEELSTMSSNYILDQNSNVNYLLYIYNIGRICDYKIDPMIRIIAKKKYDELWTKIGNKNGLSYKTEVVFEENNNVSLFNLEGTNIKCIFDINWLINNVDFPTILNNLIFVFRLVDLQYRASFVLSNSSNGLFDNFFGLHSKKEYTYGLSRDLIDKLYDIIIISYSNLLEEKDIRLEEVIKWFFETYIKDIFNIDRFTFTPSSKDANYIEKCRMLFAELEGIIKQFDFYCTYKTIDREALNFYESVEMKKIKSLLTNKYVYVDNELLENFIYLLFSNQSSIYYTEKTKDKYSSFISLITNESMCIEDFYDYQKEAINELIENKILNKVNSKITINKKVYALLYDLYNNEVINRYHTSVENELIAEYVNKGWLKYDNTLLSDEEANYFDFILNNRTYDNSRAIRNSYMHGTNVIDENQNKSDYYRLLKMLCFIILKIYDEFNTLDLTKDN